MKNNMENVISLEEIREKIGVSPKKCIYKVQDGEIFISQLQDFKLFSA